MGINGLILVSNLIPPPEFPLRKIKSIKHLPLVVINSDQSRSIYSIRGDFPFQISLWTLTCTKINISIVKRWVFSKRWLHFILQLAICLKLTCNWLKWVILNGGGTQVQKLVDLYKDDEGQIAQNCIKWKIGHHHAKCVLWFSLEIMYRK